MSAAGRALSKALDRPEDWTSGRYEITHRPSGLSFWTANWAFFFDGSPMEGTPRCLGLVERYWLYFKARKIIAAYRKDEASRRADASARVATILTESLECAQ